MGGLAMILSSHVGSVLAAHARKVATSHRGSHTICQRLADWRCISIASSSKASSAVDAKARATTHGTSIHSHVPPSKAGRRSEAGGRTSRCSETRRRADATTHSLHSGMRVHGCLKTTAVLLTGTDAKRIL